MTSAFNFDAHIDRTHSRSTKYEKYAGRDILPLWVADMDFMSPPAVREALQARVDHGVFGYTKPPRALYEAIIAHLKHRYDWQVGRADIVFLPGVVPGLNMACRGLLAPDQAAITATPVYYPFLDAPGNQQRELLTMAVELTQGGFGYPVEDLAVHAAGAGNLLMLCNPFNPVGRMLSRDELEGIAAVCEREDLLVCADEIHCDLVFDQRQHIPFASLSEAMAARTVTLMAPSKTFNIAGLGGAFAVIQNPQLRARFIAAGAGFLPGVNLLAYEAMLAAYVDGGAWHRELLAYLQANRDYLFDAINALPGITMHPVEATYLAWLDVSELELEDPPGFFEAHGLGMSGGAQYGDARFMRLNFGCPRATLEVAVARLGAALANRQ